MDLGVAVIARMTVKAYKINRVCILKEQINNDNMTRVLSVDWDRGWFVSRNWVWCWLVAGLVFRVNGHALVLDVGNESAVAVGISSVSDDLGAAVGQGYPVVTIGQFGVRL